ncbi:hypothetical protein [Nocardia sp. XZ_19_385]|uniref:hypothetical protein n=1 Tax=Nocardia sp. XZ_19_385 TaxID=2769488 RepID=UPI00188EA01E|nr:hypothetical protein [Nocardia sp. XZ_19_385]
MEDTPIEPIPAVGHRRPSAEVVQPEHVSKIIRPSVPWADPGWQAQLLRRVQHWAAEHTRITDLGPAGYDGTDLEPEQEWASQLDAVQAQLEIAEDLARQAGLEPAWIEDVRELGHRSAKPARPAESTPGTVTASTQAQQFLVDMMAVDLWNLHRMAYLVAAYQDRVVTGRSSITFTAVQQVRFDETMRAHHARATVLAHAAGITATEAEQLWGTGSRGWKVLHHSYVSAHDEAGLVTELRRYMGGETVAALPPAVLADPGARPLPGAPRVPTPEAMIADAHAAIRANFIDNAVVTGGGGAAAAAIDSALPAAEVGDWSATPMDVDQAMPGKTPELGPAPDP